MSHSQQIEGMTREQSKQALQRIGVKICKGHIGHDMICKLLAEVEPLEASEKQLVLAEAVTLIYTHFLKFMRPIYSGVEDYIWVTLSRTSDLENLVDSFQAPAEVAKYAESQYCDFLRGMFARSAKKRHEFYHDMLTEAGIVIEFNSIDFGTSAATFRRKAGRSVHMEHLLVLYSVELFLRTHMELFPKDSPIADDRLELFYRHFEEAIPLLGKFDKYAKDDELFKFSACRRRLPAIN